MELSPRMQASALTARAAAAGSMVLLKNIENTLPLLPLNEGQPLPVAVFGTGQISTALFTKDMEPWRAVSVLDGLAASTLICPDGLLSRKYRTWALEHGEGQMPLSSFSMEEFAAENEAAVVVITRQAGRYDIAFSEEEEALLAAVQGAFSRTVLILNTPGYMLLSKTAMACGAILWMGLCGQEGSYALADLLTARALPAGRLACTWPLSAADAADGAKGDLYFGYRYYDSFGKDVRFPFGYGLSYGKCELGAVSVGLDGTMVSVTAEVENTGERFPAQEVVQVYVSYPSSGKDSPCYILDCFRKTRLLSPGEKERVELRFPVTELSVFHESASAFVLEAGYYDIRVGTSCRNTCIAGSIRAMRDVVVQAVLPMKMDAAPGRTNAGVQGYSYPGEAEELSAARRHAIRLSDRALPRISRKKGRKFDGCRSDGEFHSYDDVKRGYCTNFNLVAAMDDDSLRSFVCGSFDQPAAVSGAIGATAPVAKYVIPSLTLAGGVCGLSLERDIPGEEGAPAKHQYCTAFPAPSLLSCAFDPDLVRQTGHAIGAEMKEYGIDLWLAPGAQLAADGDSESWSEDPVLTGLCAMAMAEGVRGLGAAVLRCGREETSVSLSQRAYRELFALPFEIAGSVCRACLIPAMTVSGEILGEDSELLRSMMVDWKYTGMFLSDGERYAAEPARADLERSALRILRVMQELGK